MSHPDKRLCARCGEIARGYATINNKRYCHGDDDWGTRTCYEIVASGVLGPRGESGDEFGNLVVEFIIAQCIENVTDNWPWLAREILYALHHAGFKIVPNV